MATVLVVQPDIAICAMLENVLTMAGHDVTVATNIREARCVLDTIRCDVIVTDLSLQPMDGIELLRVMRTTPSKPKLITISGDAHEVRIDPETLTALGAAAMLEQPLSEKALVSTVMRVLQ